MLKPELRPLITTEVFTLLDSLFDAEKLYTIEGRSFGNMTTIYWSLEQIKQYTQRVLHPFATHEMVMQFICLYFTDVEGFRKEESDLKNADYLWEKDFDKLPPVAKAVANYILDTMEGNYEGYDNTSTVDDMKTDFLLYCDTWEEENSAYADMMHYTDFQDLMLYENYDSLITDDNDVVVECLNLHHLFIKLLNEVGFYHYANNSTLDDINDFCAYLKTQSLVYKDEE